MPRAASLPITIRELTKTYGKVVSLDRVDLDIRSGEFLTLLGPSGSGKTTLLTVIAGFTRPDSGSVKFGDVEMVRTPPHKRGVGMVFQNFGLLPHLNVLENVAFPLQVQGVDKQTRLGRAMEMIELVGLDGREASYPRQLSGGQQQRVGIARSLAVEPELWFLDEPFSALDPLIRRQMQDEFMRLQKLLHKTIVFITHDFLEALRLGDRIAIMKDGKVVQIGTPAEVVMSPADDYVQEFTQDVPRVKVITAGDIMAPAANGLGAAQAVPPGMTLEHLMPKFSEGLDAIAVADDGRVVGQVSPQAVLAALAAADEGEARA